MVISSKEIEIYFKENNLVLTSNSKLDLKKNLLTKEILKKDIEEELLEIIINNESLNVFNYTNDFVLDSYHFIPDNFETVTVVEEVTEEVIDEEGNVEEVTEETTEEVVTEIHDFNFEIPEGWSYFSVPLDLENIIKTNENNENILTDYTSLGIDLLFRDCLYEFDDDDEPLYVKSLSTYMLTVDIVKNNVGAIYKPNWEFNGIGNTSQWEGYQIRVSAPLIFKASGKILENIDKLSDYNHTFPNGWNIFAFKSLSTDVTPNYFVSDLVEQNQVTIIKSENGEVYIPQWDFNGIGYFKPGKAYQIRFDY